MRYTIDDYIELRRMNWPVLFDDMAARGVKYSHQAELCGIPWGTYYQYQRRGAEPKHSVGQALLLLHRRVCGIPLATQRAKECDIVDNTAVTDFLFQ